MKCPKCQSEVNFREGTSKAGNPYAGDFCSNKECDYKNWHEAKPQPTNSDIIEAVRKVWHKIDKLEKQLMPDQPEPLDSDEQ